MALPTEAELEEILFNEMKDHLERMDRYDSLGKAQTAELGRVNLMNQVNVAQSSLPDKIKLDTESVSYMSEMLKKTYKELNGQDDVAENDPDA